MDHLLCCDVILDAANINKRPKLLHYVIRMKQMNTNEFVVFAKIYFRFFEIRYYCDSEIPIHQNL